MNLSTRIRIALRSVLAALNGIIARPTAADAEREVRALLVLLDNAADRQVASSARAAVAANEMNRMAQAAFDEAKRIEAVANKLDAILKGE